MNQRLNSRRTIALPATAIDILHEHKKIQAEERLKIADIWQDGNYLFTTWDGTIMHPDTPSSWFIDFLKKNNLPHIKFHVNVNQKSGHLLVRN